MSGVISTCRERPSRLERNPATQHHRVGHIDVVLRVKAIDDLAVGEPRRDPRGFEVFGNGIVVPVDDVDAFAAALEVLVEQPDLRAAMGAAGRAVAGTRFAKERLIKDMESVYDALLSRREEGRCGR